MAIISRVNVDIRLAEELKLLVNFCLPNFYFVDFEYNYLVDLSQFFFFFCLVTFIGGFDPNSMQRSTVSRTSNAKVRCKC